MPTLPEHPSSPVLNGVRVTRSLVLCVCLVDRSLFFSLTFVVYTRSDAYLKGMLLRYKKNLKIPKGQSESAHQRRRDNTMAKRQTKPNIHNTEN